jgi:hypothetical protein
MGTFYYRTPGEGTSPFQMSLDNCTIDLIPISSFDAYNENTSYSAQDIVVYQSNTYTSLVDDNEGILPDSDEESWKLENNYKACVTNADQAELDAFEAKVLLAYGVISLSEVEYNALS